MAAFVFFSYFVFLIGGIDWVTYFELEQGYGIIPDHLTAPLALAGLGFAPWNPWFENFWLSPLTGLGVGALLWAFRWLMNGILKKESLGLGDVKMLAAGGIWLGWRGVFLALLIASVLGTAVSLTLIGLKKMNRRSAVPFGPFLSFGFLSAFFLI